MAMTVLFYDSSTSRKLINKFIKKTVEEYNLTTNSSSSKYFHVNLNSKTTTARCKYDDNLIIYILSTVTNFKRRDIIRATWGSPMTGTCFIFIVGKVQNSSLIQLLLNNEQRKYNDIVQINHLESYANVIYKEVAALKWSHNNYPFIPYLFKTDDDLIIDSILLSSIAQILVTNLIINASYILKYRPQLVQTLLYSDRAKLFYSGWAMDHQPTLRDGKFRISEDIWSNQYLPAYCSGFGWLMSKIVRDKLLHASYSYPSDKLIWVGDVFVSGFLATKANVNCKFLSIDYEQTLSGNCSCLMRQQPMLTVCSSSLHGQISNDETTTYKEYKKAWRIIQQRHSLIYMNSTNSINSTSIESCT